MTDKPLGIDISRWQGAVNFQTMKAQNVRWVYLRCGISWGYEDVNFQEYRAAAKRAGIPWGAYHAVYSGQGAERQFTNIEKAMRGDWGNLPFALDMECALNQPPVTITGEILHLADLVERASGRKPIIYSRANWINDYTLNNAWRGTYNFWLAQYLSSGVEHQGPPRLPEGVAREQVLIHQTSDKGNGAQYGVSSKSIDLNRWQKSKVELLAFIGQPPAAELSDKEKLDTLWAWYLESNT